MNDHILIVIEELCDIWAVERRFEIGGDAVDEDRVSLDRIRELYCVVDPSSPATYSGVCGGERVCAEQTWKLRIDLLCFATAHSQARDLI